MVNNEELIIALERAKAQLLNRRTSTIADKESEAIRHNIKCADLVIQHYKVFGHIDDLQKDIAEKVIERANRKERIRL